MNKTTLQKNTNTDTNSSTSVPVNMYFSRSWSGNQFKEITKIFSILSIFQTNKKLRVCYLFERSKSQVTQLHKMFVIKTSPMLAKESSMLLRDGASWSAATRLLLPMILKSELLWIGLPLSSGKNRTSRVQKTSSWANNGVQIRALKSSGGRQSK